MGEIQRYEMPSGEACVYRHRDHTYWRDYNEKTKTFSGRISGASSIAKNDGQTNVDGLLDWAARLTCEGLAYIAGNTYLLDSPLILDDACSVSQALRDTKSTWRDIRDQKGDAGSAAHDVLERLCRGETPSFSGGHQMAVVDWFKKTQPEVVLAEEVVYDHVRGWAGRFDLLHGKKEPTLLDLKTGSVREAAMVQLNLYRLGCSAAGYPVPRRLVVLDTRDDGTWREIEVPIRIDWAFAALRMNSAGAEMRRVLRQAKKTAALK